MRGALWKAVLAAWLMGGAAAEAQAVFRTGDKITFNVHDIAVYQANKAAFDLYAGSIEAANKTFTSWFGPYRTPITINVNKGGCSVGGGVGSVSMGDECIINKNTREDQLFTRRVTFYFMGYSYLHGTTGGWPGTDFSQPIQRMIMINLVGEQDGEAARAKLEGEEVKTEPEKKKYQYYQNLTRNPGWTAIQELIALGKADGMAFHKVGADGSGIRNAYVFAYLSMAMGRKAGRDGQAAGITDLTPAGVMDVLRARNLLRIADRKGKATASAWAAYREGRLAEVKGLLTPQ